MAQTQTSNSMSQQIDALELSMFFAKRISDNTIYTIRETLWQKVADKLAQLLCEFDPTKSKRKEEWKISILSVAKKENYPIYDEADFVQFLKGLDRIIDKAAAIEMHTLLKLHLITHDLWRFWEKYNIKQSTYENLR